MPAYSSAAHVGIALLRPMAGGADGIAGVMVYRKLKCAHKFGRNVWGRLSSKLPSLTKGD